MDSAALIDSVSADAARFRDMAAEHLGAQVVHCPDWNVEGLVGHLSQVYRFITALATNDDPSGPPSLDREDVPGGEAVLGYFDEKRAGLLDALRDVDPSAQRWHWGPGSDASFFPRRMAHETAVHRYDVELAAGLARPIIEAVNAELAADGIDEVISVGMQSSPRGPRDDFPAGSLHLHRTDGDGEWMLSAADGALTVTHEHGKGDAAVRGSASGLYLYLWGRGRDGLDVFGDAELVDAWARVAP